jgi:predicted N-formylglutamate amidohydrolase
MGVPFSPCARLSGLVNDHSPLLAPDEPPPCLESNRGGRSNFLIVVDHASARIPRQLNDLGLSKQDLERHIAWDIGVLGMAEKMSQALDAHLLAQAYSRLVIDCNRDPNVESSIPTMSEHTLVPGNENLTPIERTARRAAVFDPYHARIKAVLDARLAAGRPTIFIAQHSMTDVYKGSRRHMHAAVLYNRDRRFAALTLEALRREPQLTVADNEPYFVSDATDYTVPMHGEARGLPHVEIEVRQDLIATEAGQQEWAERLVRALKNAESTFLNA